MVLILVGLAYLCGAILILTGLLLFVYSNLVGRRVTLWQLYKTISKNKGP